MISRSHGKPHANWALPGAACSYDATSSVDKAGVRNSLLDKNFGKPCKYYTFIHIDLAKFETSYRTTRLRTHRVTIIRTSNPSPKVIQVWHPDCRRIAWTRTLLRGDIIGRIFAGGPAAVVQLDSFSPNSSEFAGGNGNAFTGKTFVTKPLKIRH
jgi:hypothetical protein